jgi:hypothetical protein
MLSKDDITEIIGRIRELLKIHGPPGNRIHDINAVQKPAWTNNPSLVVGVLRCCQAG